MGGIAGPIQQVANTVGQIPNQLGFGQQPQQPDRGVRPPPGQVRPPGMPFYGNPNPGTYGFVNNNGVTAQTPMPGQGGFNPMQPQPAGVAYNPAYAQYENPMSSEQLQQWIAQLPPMPGVGTTYGLGGQPYPGQPQTQGQSVRNPQSPITPYGPEQLRFLQEKMQAQVQPRPIGFEGPIGNWERLNSNMMNQPTGTSADVAAQRGPNPQRGLGGLQIDKFKSRLNQR